MAIHVEDEAARAQLRALNGATNGVDELRYLFVTSAVTVLDAAPAGDFVEAETVPGLGAVTAAVCKADGRRCARCWNYSTHVGELEGHPELCERCAPVVTALGFELPPAAAAAAAEAAAAS